MKERKKEKKETHKTNNTKKERTIAKGVYKLKHLKLNL